MLSEEPFSSNEPTVQPIFLCLPCYNRWPRTALRTWMSSRSWCLVGSPKFLKLWRLQEHPASHLQVHTSPLSQGRSPPAAPGKAVMAQRLQPEVSPPAQPCQPWGHAPPGSTKQLQCRRGSGSPVYGRSTHWAPSQRTGADRRGCVHSAQASIYSVLRRLPLSPAPASWLPVSSSRSENTGAEAKDS